MNLIPSDDFDQARHQAQGPPSTQSGIHHATDDSCGFIVRPEPHPDFVTAKTRYQIIREIGSGGVGVVFLARDLDLERSVALKILRAGVDIESDLAMRFVNEARIMARLQHPGIPDVYDQGKCRDGRPFHSMMLIEGQTMHAKINDRRQNRHHQAELLTIFARLTQAVAYAHMNRVVHLDLKPGNVMLGDFGVVHLMDWGLARVRGDWPFENECESKVNGTLEYMSPEQASGQRLDERTDVFGLGAILFEILTGRTIYPSHSKRETHYLAMHGELEWAFDQLSECDAHAPLIRLAASCLDPDPDRRPSNAAVVAAEMWNYEASTLERMQTDMSRYFELSPDLFCVADQDGCLRRVNCNFARVLGYSENELLGRRFLNLLHPADNTADEFSFCQRQDRETVSTFTGRFQAVDGEFIRFHWTAKCIPREQVVVLVGKQLK